MIVKTDAIVLATMKYGDTSKIARLYTKEFGKISVIAKGVRSPKSRLRACLEPSYHVAAVIYKKENRELHLLSQCDVLETFRHVAENMDKLKTAMVALELVNVVSHDEERNEELFMTLLSHLRLVDAATKSPLPALYYFEMKLSSILGFRPELSVCTQCGETIPEEAAAAQREYGFGKSGVLCDVCGTGGKMTISPATLSVLRMLRTVSSAEAALNLQLAQPVADQVGKVLRLHLQSHVGGCRGLRSEEVFAAMT